MRAFVRRYVVLSPVQLDAVALWAAHTFTFECGVVTPYLGITSPEMGSGKTTLLRLLAHVCHRARMTAHITAPVVARIGTDKPTLLVDELDAAIGSHGGFSNTLRGVLNSGYERSGSYQVTEAINGQKVVVSFPTFYPKAYASLRLPPATILDRSILIKLKRRTDTEYIEPFRLRDVGAALAALSPEKRLTAWAEAALPSLSVADPMIPAALSDRAADCWHPLLAIAELAGGTWPERTRTAAVSLSGSEQDEQRSPAVRLLADIHQVFQDTGSTTMKTRDLLTAIFDLSEPQSDRTLNEWIIGRLLRPHDIKPKMHRYGRETARGYTRSQFEDAWRRYLR